MDIRGKVVIVTGTSSGIGAATARFAHERGAHVVLAARRAGRLERLASELSGSVSVVTDVTSAEERTRLVQRCIETHGRVDVLVNNAGQGLHVPLERVEPAAFREVLELNVVAPLALMQLVLPHMRTQHSGAIVNISSGTSRLTLPGIGAYAATKAALNKISETARAELAADGISVSLVLPSITNTEFHDVLRQGAHPERRLPFAGQAPEEVAAAIIRVIESGEEEVSLAHRPQAARR